MWPFLLFWQPIVWAVQWGAAGPKKERDEYIFLKKLYGYVGFLRRQMINWKVAQTASKIFQIIITGPLSRETKQHSRVDKNWQESPHFLSQNSYSHFVNVVFGFIY